jgi:putative membrane-bound dehydrogenase-like protein
MKEVISFDKIPPAPILSPKEAMESFKVIDGFELEQIAAEPLVQDPVSMTWDEKGRAWVVEMTSYMNDITGQNEEEPTSRIVLLSDSDGDGILDQREVVIDQLILPRSIAFYKDGLIFADHTSLYYASYKNGKLGKRELIDPKYAENGNVEHRTNGMLLNLDNWYYNAKSNIRYKFVPLDQPMPKGASEIFRNGGFKVFREDTGTRKGQWGIARDDYGRLYYNNNSSPVMVERYIGNSVKISRKYNFNKVYPSDSISNTEIYPIRMTPGINRGYMDNMLDDEYKLKKMTATCGPVVYRGDHFPSRYYNMVLAVEPSANMVKATRMSRNGEKAIGEHFYKDQEIIASTDERFRPVYQINAPDGSLTIVDLYRGILQHRGYMTSYLERQIKSRDLDKGIHLGRLYRLKRQGETLSQVQDLSKLSASKLVELLGHANAWHREQAQRLLVQNGALSEVETIKKFAVSSDNPVAEITAMWTLAGLGIFDADLLQKKLRSSNAEVVIAAAECLRSASDHGKTVEGAVEMLIQANAEEIQTHTAITRALASLNDPKGYSTILDLFQKSKKNKLQAAVTFSAFYDADQKFLSFLNSDPKGNDLLKTIKPYIKAAPKKGPKLSKKEKVMFDHGKKLYMGEAACFGCHGQQGEGMPMMGPPLDNSEWVTGSVDRLTGIMLHGLSGPIKVAGKKYAPPMIMPGLKDHPHFKDKDLASIATYIRSAWSNRSKPVSEKAFASFREKSKDRALPFTEKELLKLK